VTRPGAGEGDGPDPTDVTGAEPDSSEPVTIAVALQQLAPPEHAPPFWDDLDRHLADEPQLRLTPRAAIRPITQPPPVIDDRKLAEHLAGPRPRPRRSPARLAAWGVAVVVVALLIAAALYDPDDETQAGDRSSNATTATTATTAATTTTAAPTTTAPPGGVDPAAPLAPNGVGPLRIGTPYRDLQAAGIALTVDQATFDGSGGSCYDAQIVGALDLILRFRSPDPDVGVADPAEGVLAAVGIKADRPTTRVSDTGIGLGGPQDQVLNTYPGNIEEHSHPFIPGGRIYIAHAAPGTGLAIAYLTDGAAVNQVTVGAEDIVRFVDGCS
jgi:hypothetical protein